MRYIVLLFLLSPLFISGCQTLPPTPVPLIEGVYVGKGTIFSFGDTKFSFNHEFTVTQYIGDKFANAAKPPDTSKPSDRGSFCSWKGVSQHNRLDFSFKVTAIADCYIPEGGGWCKAPFELTGILTQKSAITSGVNKFICPKGEVTGYFSVVTNRQKK